jgi:hypothetical protein
MPEPSARQPETVAAWPFASTLTPNGSLEDTTTIDVAVDTAEAPARGIAVAAGEGSGEQARARFAGPTRVSASATSVHPQRTGIICALF